MWAGLFDLALWTGSSVVASEKQTAVAASVYTVGSAVEGPKVEAEGPRSQVVAVASVAQTYSISNGFSQYKLISNENIVGIVSWSMVLVLYAQVQWN